MAAPDSPEYEAQRDAWIAEQVRKAPPLSPEQVRVIRHALGDVLHVRNSRAA